jgi:aminoglycoside 6'-N-acetyltransferase I
MIIRHVEPEETEDWLPLRMALWPETDAQQHRKEIAMMLSDADRLAVFVAEDRTGSLVGFAEASLREWAEGCTFSPVGYLEGWFVVPHARRQGVGAALLAAAEDWARARGCTEMASDTELGNDVSEAAHRKLGYRVAARVVAFRKALR